MEKEMIKLNKENNTCFSCGLKTEVINIHFQKPKMTTGNYINLCPKCSQELITRLKNFKQYSSSA